MGQVLSFPARAPPVAPGAIVTVVVAAVYLLSYFLTRRPMHEPGHVDPSIEESILAARGECGHKAHLEERRRDREEHPVPPYLENWHNLSEINLAVTGESGTGKSSLINALIGGNVAKTGVSETTEVPQKPYKLPIMDELWAPMDVPLGAINLWDLPGQGTLNFPADRYIRDLGVRYYDAVILVLHNRVKEANLKLVRELQKHNVPVVVVINKMDDIVKSSKHDSTKRNMDETFEHVREKFTKDFNRGGCVGISMFLLSSRRIIKERADFIVVGADPMNREWKAFQYALVDAVGKARGVAERHLESVAQSMGVSRRASMHQPATVRVWGRTADGPQS